VAQIQVSDHVHEELKRLKQEEEHSTFDSLIRSMAANYEVSEF